MGLENKFFDWNEWNIHDTMALSLYECICNMNIGPYKKGQFINRIFMDFENGVCEFYINKDSETEPDYLFKFEISIKE